MQNTGVMIRAQNDLYMVTTDSESNSLHDDSMEALAEGRTTRGEYQRCVGNICRMLMRSPVMERFLGKIPEDDLIVIGDEEAEDEERQSLTHYTVEDGVSLDMSAVSTEQGNSEVFGFQMKEPGIYNITAKMRASADTPELSQMALSVFMDNQIKGTFRISGADREWTEQSLDVGFVMGNHYIKLYFSMGGMELNEVCFKKTGEMQSPF